MLQVVRNHYLLPLHVMLMTHIEPIIHILAPGNFLKNELKNRTFAQNVLVMHSHKSFLMCMSTL